MEFFKKKVNASPYIGVFCCLTENNLLVPHGNKKNFEAPSKEMKMQIIETTAASSALLGIFMKCFEKKAVVSYLLEESEKQKLEQNGFEVKQVEETAIGNLMALNQDGGIASPVLSDKLVKELEKFFEVPFTKTSIAQSMVVGSCTCVTNKGFIVHPNISESELRLLEKIFKVKGEPATANYGDRFVANSVIANTKGVIAGENTSGHEFARIDEGLGGDQE
jgi:translation initiation factor 6